MARKRTKKSDAPISLIDATIEVPEEQHGWIENPEKGFRIIFNRTAIELARQVADELAMARGLPVDPDEISAMDPITLWFMEHKTYLSGTEARRHAIAYYKRLIQACSRDGIIVAMTENNDLLNMPKEYKPGEDTFTGEATAHGEPVPAWRAALADEQPPTPDRSMNNPYERRLKQVGDFVAECGVMFATRFYTTINDGIAKTVRELGEETDDSGFPVQPPSE
jgi:hypothetical protein